MKKCLLGLILFAVSSAFAGVDNVVIMFSTLGPDTYADGSTVLDGEKYALVWTPSDSTYGGIAADGKAVSPSVVVLKASAKGGRCPDVQFQVDGAYADEHYPNGSWSVVMLDTRRFAVDAVTKVIDRTTVESVGGDVVNGSAVVATPNISRTGASSETVASPIAAGSERAMPAGADELKISGIEFEGELVKITATGAKSCLTYGLKAGDEVGKLQADASAGERYGEANGELIIYTPKKEGAQFYGISGK